MTLAGKTILITRRREQSDQFVRAVREQGGTPVVIPLVAIGPPPSWEACDGALSRLASFDAAAFTSANAVEAFVGRALARGVTAPDLERLPAAAVGEATAAALRRSGMRVALVPAEFSAASLGAALGGALRGKRVLLPCGTIARGTLAGALREQGASVESVVVYATLPAEEAGASGLVSRVLAGEFDVVTFASPSAARHFGALFTPPERGGLRARCRIAAIGATTEEALRAMDIPPDIVAGESSARGIVESITAYFRAQ